MSKSYRELIEKNYDEFLEDLKTIINIPSVNVEDESDTPFGQGIQDALEKMLSICEKLGLETYCDLEGYYGYADYGTGDEVIGVLGHLDVVPPGDLEKWATDPFEAVIKDGNIYGRGTQDDKGPTLAALYALKSVIDSGLVMDKKVRFIFGTDEELLWRGIAKYSEKEKMQDYGFTPDANFPLIFAEKGLLQVDFVAEGTDAISLTGGDAYNAVPSTMNYECTGAEEKDNLSAVLDKAGFEYKVDGLNFNLIGKSVHAKDSEKGINAISRLCIALKEIGHSSKAVDFIANEIGEDALANKLFGINYQKFQKPMALNLKRMTS